MTPENGTLIHTDEEGQDFYQFPTIEQMLEITEENLKEQKFGYRSKYIVKSVKTIHDNGGEKWVG